MKGSSKKWALGLMAAIATTALPVSAQDCCWNPCDLDGCFEVGGEALWLKPTGATYDYGLAVVDTTTRNFTVTANYDWGFRIYGSYYMGDCCNVITLDWTYLRTSDRDAQTGENLVLFNINEPLNSIEARIKFDYDKVNLRFARNICCGCDSQLSAYVGARYVEMKRSHQVAGVTGVTAAGSVVQTKVSTRLEAGGLEAGFAATHSIWCDFDLVANFGLTTQIGNVRNKSSRIIPEGITSTLSADYTTPSRTICVPGAEFKLGISYTYKCDCWWITGDFGYQLDYYWNAVSVNNSIRPQSFDRTNVGFGGIYFGLRARF